MQFHNEQMGSCGKLCRNCANLSCAKNPGQLNGLGVALPTYPAIEKEQPNLLLPLAIGALLVYLFINANQKG